MSATIEDVARAAGVSKSTVSRVLNADPRVSETARVATERSIADLNYVVNQTARELARRRGG